MLVDDGSHTVLTNVKEIFNNLDIWTLFSNLLYCYHCYRRTKAQIYNKNNTLCLLFLRLSPIPISVCVCVCVGWFLFRFFNFKCFFPILLFLHISLAYFVFVHRAGKCSIRDCLCHVRKSFYSWNFLLFFFVFFILLTIYSRSLARMMCSSFALGFRFRKQNGKATQKCERTNGRKENTHDWYRQSDRTHK